MLFPPDAVTGNRVFMFGSLEKATLQRERRENAALKISGGKTKCGEVCQSGVKDRTKMSLIVNTRRSRSCCRGCKTEKPRYSTVMVQYE